MYGLLKLLAKIPPSIWYLLVPAATFVLHRMTRYRIAMVQDNLSHAFPDLSIEDRNRITAESYRRMVEVALESVRAATMKAEDVSQHFSIENPELIDGLAKKYKSVVVVSGHQGNWEWFLLACAIQLNVPLDAVYRPLHNQGADRFFCESRTRFGGHLVVERDAIKSVMERRSINRLIGLMGDQRAARKEPRYWTTFLNRDAAFHTGWIKIAAFGKYPVVFAQCERIGRGQYRARFEQLAEPPYDRNPGPLIENYISVLTSAIQRDPAAYLWTHNRWREPRPLYDK